MSFDIHLPTPLKDAQALFALDNAARRLTPRTRERYAWELRLFVFWCNTQGVFFVKDLQPAHGRAYALYLSELTGAHGKPLASETVHGRLRTVRRFLAFCVEEEIVAKSPFSKLKMPKTEKKILKSLSPAEVDRVLRACTNRRDKAMLLFLVDTGVRAAELCALTVGSVDFVTGSVEVAGKGQKWRTVYLGNTARKELRRYLLNRGALSTSAPLFAALKATPGYGIAAVERPLTPNALVLWANRLKERSGVAHLTCHALRRTFAITCLRNGMNIYTLKKLMGHADLTMLLRYLDVVETDAQSGHERFGPVDHATTRRTAALAIQK